MSLVLPFLFAVLGIGSAVMVVLKREAMQGALFLIVTLFSVAAIYLFLHAEFLAAVQIIIYAGAIMVLIIFVIQLIGTDSSAGRINNAQTPIAVGAAALLLIQLGILAARSLPSFNGNGPAADSGLGKTLMFSTALFTKFIFPFEIASVLLLVAVIGTVILAQKKGVRE